VDLSYDRLLMMMILETAVKRLVVRQEYPPPCTGSPLSLQNLESNLVNATGGQGIYCHIGAQLHALKRTASVQVFGF
jgi:hypothetical protein